MDKPMNTGEFFCLICDRLSEKNQMPEDLLDYCLETSHPVPMLTYEFDIRNNLDYGGSEGIYLDMSVRIWEDGKPVMRELGTFKTLQTSHAAMRAMAQLLADFIVEAGEYTNSHLDDFTWIGFDVYPLKEDGPKTIACYTCIQDGEQAAARKDELLQKYPAVMIRNNRTRSEKIFRKTSGGDE